MSEHVIPGRRGGLISLSTADSLWVDLTSGSAVPTAVAAFTCSPADARAGYVLLGGRVVTTVTADGSRWSVPQTEVRRAAAELNAVQMERQDLVRIGPFGGMPGQEHDEGMLLPWRRRISRELQEPGETGRAARDEGSRPSHLAGIDWRRVLVEQPHGRAAGTWWLPRAVVRVLDAAEHAERRWLHATRQASQTPVELSSTHRQAKAAAGRETTSTDDSATVLQVYNGELKGQLYSAVSRKPGVCGKVAGWACAVCRTAPAAVLDHCHEHGYVRAPVCHSCNTQERPDHLYSNDIRVVSPLHASSTPTPPTGSLTGTDALAAEPAPRCPCRTSPHGPPTQPAVPCARPTAPPRAQTVRSAARVLDGQPERARVLSAHRRRRPLSHWRAPSPDAGSLSRSRPTVSYLAGRGGPGRGCRGRSRPPGRPPRPGPSRHRGYQR